MFSKKEASEEKEKRLIHSWDSRELYLRTLSKRKIGKRLTVWSEIPVDILAVRRDCISVALLFPWQI